MTVIVGMGLNRRERRKRKEERREGRKEREENRERYVERTINWNLENILFLFVLYHVPFCDNISWQ